MAPKEELNPSKPLLTSHDPKISSTYVSEEDLTIPISSQSQILTSTQEEYEVIPVIYHRYKDHWIIMLIWIILSICVVALMPFSETIDLNESLLYASGPWIAILAALIYFIILPCKKMPVITKNGSLLVLIFAILSLIMDIMSGIGLIWALQYHWENYKEDEKIYFYFISSIIMIIHGVATVFVMAKMMIVGTYSTHSVRTYRTYNSRKNMNV